MEEAINFALWLMYNDPDVFYKYQNDVEPRQAFEDLYEEYLKEIRN